MIHSLRDVFIPNRITKAFLAGNRHMYVHPFRFFFICLVIFFGLLSLNMKDFNIGGYKLKESMTKYDDYIAFDTLSRQYELQCQAGVMDSIRDDLFSDYTELDKDTFFRITLFGSDLTQYGISTVDGIGLENDSLYSKYNIESSRDRFFIQQYKRVVLDPESAIRFVIGNMIWGVILLTIMVAFVLKLLYWRHESYYIEHILHITTLHSLCFLLMSIAMIFELIIPLEILGESVVIIFLGGVVYLFTLLNRYYGEHFLKTIIKLFILSLAYWMSLILIMIIISMFSFAIY